MIGKLIVVSTTIAVIIVTAIFQFKSPSEIGPIGLLAVFFLLYVIALGIVTWLLWAVSKTIVLVGARLNLRRPPVALTLRQVYYFSSLLALAPVMMLAMQSIGSLGVYEGALILAFLAIGILYISRRNF